VVIDATQINNIDYTAGKTLVQLRQELDRRGVGLASVALPEGVLSELERYRALGGKPPTHGIFSTVDEAVEALRDARPPAQRETKA